MKRLKFMLDCELLEVYGDNESDFHVIQLRGKEQIISIYCMSSSVLLEDLRAFGLSDSQLRELTKAITSVAH